MVTIKEFNEFTWDMVRALPRVYYHHTNDIPFKLECKKGLRSIYEPFCDNITEHKMFDERNDARTYSHSRPWFTEESWTPPPLKTTWSGRLTFDKPTVVIQNKYSLEWSRGTFNYFPVNVLDEIFKLLKHDYQIIYIRPRGNDENYFVDRNKLLKFEDYSFIEANHSEIITIEDLMTENPEMDYNTLQFAAHATSDKHISVSGGNACIASYFGGDVVIFDSPAVKGGRGIWKTNSWLSLLGDSNIYGVNNYNSLVTKIKDLWT